MIRASRKNTISNRIFSEKLARKSHFGPRLAALASNNLFFDENSGNPIN